MHSVWSSRMWRRVVCYIYTNIPEEGHNSIFMLFCGPSYFLLQLCSYYPMLSQLFSCQPTPDAVCSSKMWCHFYQTTRCRITKLSILKSFNFSSLMISNHIFLFSRVHVFAWATEFPMIYSKPIILNLQWHSSYSTFCVITRFERSSQQTTLLWSVHYDQLSFATVKTEFISHPSTLIT
jgi:hypothetical protein